MSDEVTTIFGHAMQRYAKTATMVSSAMVDASILNGERSILVFRDKGMRDLWFGSAIESVAPGSCSIDQETHMITFPTGSSVRFYCPEEMQGHEFDFVEMDKFTEDDFRKMQERLK